MRRPFVLFFIWFCACSDGTQTAADAGDREDAGVADRGGMMLDSGAGPDAAEKDAGIADRDPGLDAEPMDADTPDDGVMPLMEEMVPGSHVQVREGRVGIGATFQEVTGLLGPGARSAAENARSYEWSLSGGVMLTVWFANGNLDADDAPPNDVDQTDRVLWIVAQGFGGTTPEGIGVGATRSAVEAAYGAAPHSVPIPNPAGTLAQYFTTGLLVAYAPDDTVRTVTICRAYVQAPDGEIDPRDARLRFASGDVQGIRSLIELGTDDSDVLARLGEPDGRGTLSLGGQDLEAFSYGFIGVEVFFLENEDDVLFMTVHAPYYGTTAGGIGVGASRIDVEQYLSGEGYNAGTAATNPQLICYEHGGSDEMVGVTYDENDVATTFNVPIPLGMCP